jgi:hypothetical protein
MDRTPRMLGIIAICLGGLTSLTSLFGLVAHAFMKSALGSMGQFFDKLPRRPGQPSMGDMMEKTSEVMDAVRPYQIAQSGGMLLLSLLLVAIGIGMVKRQAWSRSSAQVWAVAALAFIPVMVWIQAFVIQPRTQEAVYSTMPMDQRVAPVMKGMQSFQAAATGAGTVTFYAPFPIVLLALVGRQKSRAWFEPDKQGDPPGAGP